MICFAAPGFYRPESVHALRPPAGEQLQPVAEFTWEDWLSARTIPNFYGGEDPVAGRDYPRLRIVVFRVVEPWVAVRSEE